MLEFSSISVSSYDAASLADKLTEKSGDGWGVVSVVAAGTNVTAYLSRERSQAAAGEGSQRRDEPAPAATPLDGGTSTTQEQPAAASEPSFEPVLPASSSTSGTATPFTPSTPSTPSVEEPAGWAVEPEPAASTPAASETTSWGGGTTAADVQPATETRPADIVTPEPVSSYESVSSHEPASSQPAASAATTSESTQSSGASQSASSTATAPAGWYADPSGRYELRYWDGTQWTEHVSRAGQQYTDPPVA
jgi:hypothetical protein